MKTYPSAEHQPAYRFPLHALPMLLLCLTAAWGQDVDLSRLHAVKTYRTPSRRFAVVGSNTLDNLEAGRWAETLRTRAEEIVGGPISFSRREIRIIIRSSVNAETGTLAVAECGPLALRQGLEANRLVQRMIVPRAECLAEESVRIAFCRLLLQGFVPSSRIDPTPVQVPRWLPVGLARNLWREQRGADAFAMVERWREGRVPPLADWLERGPDEWDTATDGPMSALLVAWLAEPPDGYGCLRELFRRLDEGETVSAGLFASVLLGAGAGPADLEVAWDGWIMRQQRKVFRPGTMPADVLKQLAAELLLYPGAFGIPLASDIRRGDGFHALIEQRNADWIDTFCHAKQASLGAVVVGRGMAVQEVVTQYVAFLDALARGKRSRRLRKLLDEAEAARRDLEASVESSLPVAMSETDHGNTDTQDAGGESR
ncbi:MAG: hypothetical protein ISS31_03935 [Kiritimatiellae bacterium]|nr:hypothetical protein [Kiritimatiellia bacterium]